VNRFTACTKALSTATMAKITSNDMSELLHLVNDPRIDDDDCDRINELRNSITMLRDNSQHGSGRRSAYNAILEATSPIINYELLDTYIDTAYRFYWEDIVGYSNVG
jgi:hypothetical protein